MALSNSTWNCKIGSMFRKGENSPNIRPLEAAVSLILKITSIMNFRI